MSKPPIEAAFSLPIRSRHVTKPRIQTLAPRVASLQTQRTQTMAAGSWRTSTMSSAARGYGHKWRVEREKFLRLNPLCCMCQAQGLVTAATVVDHRTPHQGNERLFWDRSNWQGLCTHHHSSDKQREEAEARVLGG